MLKRKKVGLIVWGVILSAIGGVLIPLMMMSAPDFFSDSGNRSSLVFWIVTAVMLAIGGTLMLVFGIVNAVKVSRYNNRILSETKDLIYIATCFNCGYQISAKYMDFTPHSRYPEGFVYCPVCKKPCSRNVFRAYKQEPGGTYGG